MLYISHRLQLDRKEKEWRQHKAAYQLSLFCIVDVQDGVDLLRGVGCKHHKLNIFPSIHQIHPITEEVKANILAHKEKKRKIKRNPTYHVHLSGSGLPHSKCLFLNLSICT